MSSFKDKIVELIHIKRISDFSAIQNIFAINGKEIVKGVIKELDKIDSIISSDFRYLFNDPKESVIKLTKPTFHQPVLSNYEFKVDLVDLDNKKHVTTVSVSIRYDFEKDRLYGDVESNFKHLLTGYERFYTAPESPDRKTDYVLIDILDKVNVGQDKVKLSNFFTDRHRVSATVEFV